jgi:ElaB/YqjD/DUF883 family membrane-anchored ribosome-binding protein
MSESTQPKNDDTRLDRAKRIQDTAESLLADWRRALTHAVDETEKFAKEKPLVALGISFAAGTVFNELMSALFRRRRK